MTALLLRLLALVAVALMPLGMLSAPASAQPATGAMVDAHCAGEHDQGQEPAPASRDADCMACAGLPVASRPTEPAPPMLRAPRRLSLSREFTGIEPEIVPPPPKRA